MEKVSVVIPVYNAEKYLSECIESALGQTYKDVEVIAVNDGSTDNSLQILNKYADRIRIITKPNGGTASALNAGIKESTGEWIKPLGADDTLYRDAVEVLVSEAKEFPDRTNTIFYANYDFIDPNGKIRGSHSEPNYNSLTRFDFNVILLDHAIGGEGTVLTHKSAFEKYGYYDERYGYEDFELRLRFCLLHNYRMHYIPKTLATYRMHENQISRTSIRKELERKDLIRKSILDKIDLDERRKYELALVNYQKTRPITFKLFAYVGNNLLPHLPKFISLKILFIYWTLKRKSSNLNDLQ